jgi:hypothetical protein
MMMTTTVTRNGGRLVDLDQEGSKGRQWKSPGALPESAAEEQATLGAVVGAVELKAAVTPNQAMMTAAAKEIRGPAAVELRVR